MKCRIPWFLFVAIVWGLCVGVHALVLSIMKRKTQISYPGTAGPGETSYAL